MQSNARFSRGDFFCDDALKEQVSMFKSGTLTAGIDEDDDAIFAELLGKTVDEETGVVVSNVNDVPIYVGFGHIVPKMINGAKKYKVEFFPKMVRSAPRPVGDAGALTNRKK